MLWGGGEGYLCIHQHIFLEYSVQKISHIPTTPLLDTLLELRCLLAPVGCVAPSIISSCIPDVTLDVVDATDAECARRADNSRVSRFTTASCSFSNSRCSSAAVSGRGCRIGTPAASKLGTEPVRLGLWGEARGRGGGDMGSVVVSIVVNNRARIEGRW